MFARNFKIGWIYAPTVLLSAFLLFSVQPLIGKAILPWFGGSPGVWTTCMLFFQLLLLGGYAYAHASVRWLSERGQFCTHAALLAGAAVVCQILPSPDWKPSPNDSPILSILVLLGVCVGLPYFTLAATGPLVQTWFRRACSGESPYRLYSLSNIGSLAALLAYPLLVETHFDLQSQAHYWSLGFLAFAILCAIGGRIAVGKSANALQHKSQVTQTSPVTWRERGLWVGLSGLASLMLLATTNHICQDVAVIPFLWIAPLGLYLISFILAFDHDRWYWHKLYPAATIAMILATAIVEQLIQQGSGIHFTFVEELSTYLLAMFCLCMVCHGELARRKPDPCHLTEFYLFISIGGALGGLLVSVAAPLAFTTFLEWRLGLVLGCGLAGGVLLANHVKLCPAQIRRMTVMAVLALVAFVGLNAAPPIGRSKDDPRVVYTRNFYGTANVLDRFADSPDLSQTQLYSGQIVHGLQFHAAAMRREPTAYYGRNSGLGLTFAAMERDAPRRVALVGLGAGTAATYARKGDLFRFFEINPNMVRLAQQYFSFLSDSAGLCEIVPGDARLSLERDSGEPYDMIVLDAFSGDAVPTHLLTQEALQIYRSRLRAQGALVVHVSNRYLDLVRVVEGLAASIGWPATHISSAGDASHGVFPAEYVILTQREELTRTLQSHAHTSQAQPCVLWTDSHSNLLEILQ